MESKKRIVVVSNLFAPRSVGGAEIVAYNLAAQYAELGHDVTVFAGKIVPDCEPPLFFEAETYRNLLVHRVALHAESFSYRSNSFANPMIEDYFEDLCRTVRPDFVHCHNLIGLSVNLPRIARIAGAKSIVTLHDYWGICPIQTLIYRDGVCQDHSRCSDCVDHIEVAGTNFSPSVRKSYIKRALRDADRLISPSRFLKEAYESDGIGSVDVISNGVPEAFFVKPHERSSSRTTFCYVGILSAHKGVRTLVDAFKRLTKSPARKSIRLWIVGTGPLHEEISRELDHLDRKVELKMLGRLENEQIPDILSETDCLVLPSIYPENQPCTVLEAFAAGVPVIASIAGGNPELVSNGDRGFLFESGSSEDLATRMLQFVALPLEQRAEISRNCLQFAACLRYREVAAEYLECFERTGKAERKWPPSGGSVWIDVSSFLSHTRIVGLTRPIVEIIKRRARFPGNFRFYCYSSGNVREVSGNEVDNKLSTYRGHEDQRSSSSGDAKRLKWTQDDNLAAVKRARIRERIKKIVYLVPFAKRPAKWLAAFLRRSLQFLRRRKVRRIASEAAARLPKSLPFEEGDTILMLAYEPSIHFFLDCDFSRYRIISYLYDLIPIDLPFLYHSKPGWSNSEFERHISILAAISSEMWVISDYARNDFISYSRRSRLIRPVSDSIRVLHLGGEVRSAKTGMQPKENYILYVSTLEPRKNHRVICNAYTILLERNLDPPNCIFAGLSDVAYPEILDEILLDPRLKGKISHKGGVSDEELSALYEHALFTIYPSIAEGWGLPVSESLSHGKFVLCSSTTSLPEVGGAFCEYIHPYDVTAWADRIMYYSSNREVLVQKEEEIRKNYRPRTWTEFVQDVVDRSDGS